MAKVRRFGIAFYKQSVEQRRRNTKLLYDLETELRKEVGNPTSVYGGERELFRFHDGCFASSQEHADWALLRKRGG